MAEVLLEQHSQAPLVSGLRAGLPVAGPPAPTPMPPTASLSKQIATWREWGIRGSGALPAPLGDDQGSGPHWAWGVQQGSPRALRSTWGEKKFEGLPREGRGQGTGAPQPSPLCLPGAGGKGRPTGHVQALDTKSPVSQMRRSLCPGEVALAHLVDILSPCPTLWRGNVLGAKWVCRSMV